MFYRLKVYYYVEIWLYLTILNLASHEKIPAGR
jgi:hypothetical protein